MRPPARLDKMERAEWRRVVGLLEQRGQVDEAWMPMIRRYVCSLVLAERARGEVPTDSVLTFGSQDQLVEHPAAKLALKAEEEASKWGQALGLEPQAPAKMPGRPKGSVPLNAPRQAVSGLGVSPAAKLRSVG